MTCVVPFTLLAFGTVRGGWRQFSGSMTSKYPDLTNRILVNQKELALLIGRSPRFVANLAKARKIPEVKLSKKARLYDVQKVLLALSRFETQAIGATQ